MNRVYGYSLRRRLLVLLLGVTFAFWTVVAAVTVYGTIDETSEIFDTNLARAGLALLHVADPDDLEPYPISDDHRVEAIEILTRTLPDLLARLAGERAISESAAAPDAADIPVVDAPDAMRAEYERKVRYQIWTIDGRLLLRSALAPEQPIASRDGFSDSTDVNGNLWRNFSVWDRHHVYRVVISETHDLRGMLLSSFVLHIVAPMLLGLPVLVLLLWFVIQRGTGALGDIAREIGQRKPETLTPLNVRFVPEEVRPMAHALNRLMERVSRALENERWFTSNAAHELRTPLAAIQVHLHAARAARNAAERECGLEQAQRGLERGARMVDQLLTLARLDPEQSVPDVTSVDLAALAEAATADLAPGALRKNQTIECSVDPDLPAVRGNADLLHMLASNLIDNAIRYTPAGGRIEVALRKAQGGVTLEVSDTGPGIGAQRRARVFDRFYRLAGQDQPGTGLGLAICKRIAELHRARIELGDRPGGPGLVVRVFVPTRPPADRNDDAQREARALTRPRPESAPVDPP